MAENVSLLMARLRAAEGNPHADDVEQTIRNTLAAENNRLVGRAAALVAQHEWEDFEDDLRSAYTRFLEDPCEKDPGCEAKTKLCGALRLTGYADGDFFYNGIRYRQFDPAYPEAIDSAAELRAICGFALIQLNDSRAMRALVDLLGDPEKTARAGAARAIAHGRGETAELLLRLKIQLGDVEPEVLGECFDGILRINVRDGIASVAEFLSHHNEDVQCEAALALAYTRDAVAFAPLRRKADARPSRDFERALLMSIGLLGVPESIDYLLQVISAGDEDAAIEAVRALRHCRDVRTFGERLLQAADRANNRLISQACANEFPELNAH